MAGPKSPDNESLRLELKEAITAFHAGITLMAQSLGILITANILLLAYGFSQRRSGILLIASLTPVAMFVLYIDILATLVPISYVAVTLEKKLSLQDAPLIGTYAKSRQGLVPALFSDIDKPEVLAARGFVPNIPFRFLVRDLKSLLILLSFVLQICLFAVSIIVFDYPFM
jgi:hypothetical protein